MARGYCYEIGYDLNAVNTLTKDDLRELAGLKFDYINDIEKENAEEIAREFADFLKSKGADIKPFEDIEGNGYEIVFPEGFKEKYFRNQFDRFKELVNKLNLKDFASRDCSWKLKQAITQTGDAVYYEDYFCPLDEFIRDIFEGKKYYLTNRVVLMH